MPPDGDNGWAAWRELVLTRLDEHTAALKCVDGKVSTARVEIAKLKLKAGLWGAAMGTLPVIAALLLLLLKG